MSHPPQEPVVAFLAGGRLYLREPGREPRELESTFAKEVLERRRKQEQTDGWRGRSGVWGAMGLGPPEMAQWSQAGEEFSRPAARFAGLARTNKPNELLYLLDLDEVHGLFIYHLGERVERRLMHRQGFAAAGLAVQPEHGALAISLRHPDGSGSISLSEDEGRHWSSITGGDSLDEAPAWTTEGKRLVFHSAGIGRLANGLRGGLGPARLEALDLTGEGEVQVLLADERYDFLAPCCAADGAIYLLRRPYRPLRGNELSFREYLLDVVLFPYRLLRTFFYLAHFLSLMVTGRPLANTAQQASSWTAPQQQALTLWGQAVDTKKALARGANQPPPPVAARDWQVVRWRPGVVEPLVDGAWAFCLLGERIVYSDGGAVHERAASGAVRKLFDYPLVTTLVAWDEAVLRG